MDAVVERHSESPDAKGNFPVQLKITNEGRLGAYLQDGLTGDAAIFFKKNLFSAIYLQRSRNDFLKIIDQLNHDENSWENPKQSPLNSPRLILRHDP